MNETSAETRTVMVERELPHPPERVWRALTQPQFMEEWLMKTDFAPSAGHRFEFRAEWGKIDCRVLEVQPFSTLSYTWEGNGLESIVTWTLTPTGAGTRLRMEQSGFQADQRQAYHGARTGWPRFLDRLEQVLAQID